MKHKKMDFERFLRSASLSH